MRTAGLAVVAEGGLVEGVDHEGSAPDRLLRVAVHLDAPRGPGDDEFRPGVGRGKGEEKEKDRSARLRAASIVPERSGTALGRAKTSWARSAGILSRECLRAAHIRVRCASKSLQINRMPCSVSGDPKHEGRGPCGGPRPLSEAATP